MTTTISPSEVRYQRLELATDRVETLENIPIIDIFRRTRMHKSAVETFWVVAYGPTPNVASVFEVARGRYVEVGLHIPSLMGGVLTAGVERFELAHNHVHDSIKPSPADIELTRSVMNAANANGLQFTDHYIIVNSGRFYSFRDHGLLVPAPMAVYDKAAGR